jgi:lipoyl(octanoyl) transferase
VRVVDLGLVPYREALAIQLERVAAVLAGAEDALFLLEHPPVVTLGVRGGAEHLPADPAFLAKRGVEVVKTGRGGGITCHFPGQLVAYPVCRVAGRPGGVRGLVRDLEEAAIRACARFGVAAGRRADHPGVWVGAGRKIGSVGIALRRFVSFHGLALNVGPNLDLFDRITPCGIPGARATSLSIEAGREIFVQEVGHVLADELTALLAPA